VTRSGEVHNNFASIPLRVKVYAPRLCTAPGLGARRGQLTEGTCEGRTKRQSQVASAASRLAPSAAVDSASRTPRRDELGYDPGPSCPRCGRDCVNDCTVVFSARHCKRALRMSRITAPQGASGAEASLEAAWTRAFDRDSRRSKPHKIAHGLLHKPNRAVSVVRQAGTVTNARQRVARLAGGVESPALSAVS